LKKVWLLILPLAVVVGVIVWGVVRKSAPPQVRFVPPKRITLVSTLLANGKVEPFEWQAVRAEASGLVGSVPVREGQTVAKGVLLAETADPALAADIRSGEARVAEARAALAALQAGGRPVDLSEIETSLGRARFDLARQEEEYNSLRRLAEKQAATRVDVQAARDRVEQTRMEIAGLERRRAALVAKTEVAAAQARFQSAETALNLARQRAAQSAIRAPIAGEVYGLEVRPGSYVDPGDVIANIGRLDRVRVRVYVDEPELGRVAVGQAVTIRWQALPGREWQGTVERKPTAIEALGSRQVGQVVCTIENPGHELIPGTNVDAAIRTAVSPNALVIPKEALRHDPQGDYVFVLDAGTLRRRAVTTGNASVTDVRIAEGLSDNDSVAMPSDLPLTNGERVTPIS
jgi:HlyD family secretion protein